MKLSKNILFLTIYAFIIIFQPPILPISMIYVTGVFISLILLYENKGFFSFEILKNSKLLYFIYTIIGMFLYLLVVSILDANFITTQFDLLTNRLKCINQLTLLIGIQIVFVYYFLLKAKKFNIELNDLLNVIIYAGLLQSICGFLAYISPTIRNIFLINAAKLHFNPWSYERRGFGFSSMLIDLFGYAMGLIAGYVFLLRNKNLLIKITFILMLLFSILFNARTGIVVFLLSLLIYIFSGTKKVIFIKSSIFLIICFICYIHIIPFFFELCINSSNNNLKWVAGTFKRVYESINSRNLDTSSFTFISNILPMPQNTFQYIFGTGHSVYGISDVIGMHSDIGYINLLWTYGIFGTVIILSLFTYLFYYTYKKCYTTETKLIAIFNYIAYFVVLIKGQLLGYNPGTCITYLVTFSLIYYGNKIDNIKRID